MAVKKHILSIEEGTTVNAWPFDGTVTFTLPSDDVQALLSATDAADARTELGLGTLATINLSGDNGDVLKGDGTFAPAGSSGGGLTYSQTLGMVMLG